MEMSLSNNSYHHQHNIINHNHNHNNNNNNIITSKLSCHHHRWAARPHGPSPILLTSRVVVTATATTASTTLSCNTTR